MAEYFGLKKAAGALVNSVEDDSPASKAGLRRGDIILEFNEQKVSTPEDLQTLVKETKIGSQVIVLLQRNKQTLYVTVKIEERK